MFRPFGDVVALKPAAKHEWTLIELIEDEMYLLVFTF